MLSYCACRKQNLPDFHIVEVALNAMQGDTLMNRSTMQLMCNAQTACHLHLQHMHYDMRHMQSDAS